MNHHSFNPEHLALTRREFLNRCGMGMGALGLTGLLGTSLTNSADAAEMISPLVPDQPHFPPKAKRVIHIFANGGPSHVDTFDPKPALAKYHGKEIPIQLRTERKTGAAFKSPYSFKKYGQSGIEVSELFAQTAEKHIDDMCLIRSMHRSVPNHPPSTLEMTCGDPIQSRPSMGAWALYGLGTENQNLPGLVSLCPEGYPGRFGPRYWGSGFLSGAYQGQYMPAPRKPVQSPRAIA